MTCFNLGGLIGTLLTIPLATRMGRRPMFYIYFSLSALTIYCAFGIPLDPEFRFLAQFFVGLCVFGVFGSFTFYLPELFPARLRGTGSGFCYNAGRFLVCLGPFFVGDLLSTSSSSAEILHLLSLIALLPIAAVIFLAAGYGEETRQELST
jgi:MFS family permease